VEAVRECVARSTDLFLGISRTHMPPGAKNGPKRERTGVALDHEQR